MRAAVALGLCGLAVGCGGHTAHQLKPPAPSSTTSSTLVDPETGVPLARSFNHTLGTANGALFAFGERLNAGLGSVGTVLPSDLIADANALATAELGVAATLQGQSWPPSVEAAIGNVVSALRTFAADLQILSGLSPTLIDEWRQQYARDGGLLNNAEDIVRAQLGATPSGSA